MPDPSGILNPNPRNNYVVNAGGNVEPWDKLDIKADHNFTEKDRIAMAGAGSSVHLATEMLIRLRGKVDRWMGATRDPRVVPTYDEWDRFPYYGKSPK